MTDRQKVLLEDEINIIQSRIDDAKHFAEVDNFYGQHETAKHWTRHADEEDAKMNGMKIALSVLGYKIEWKDGKRIIVLA